MIAFLALVATIMQPDGYSCEADAFRSVAAIHGEGRGVVELHAGPDYALTSATFRFTVNDRVTGYRRLLLAWTLEGTTLDERARFSTLRIPLRVKAVDGFTATILDGDQALGSRRFVRRGDGFVPADAPPGARPDDAVASYAADAWLPDLRGRGTLGYTITASDGRVIDSDTFLLPDLRKSAGAIRAAYRSAQRLLKKRACNRFIVLGRTPPAAQ